MHTTVYLPLYTCYYCYNAAIGHFIIITLTLLFWLFYTVDVTPVNRLYHSQYYTDNCCTIVFHSLQSCYPVMLKCILCIYVVFAFWNDHLTWLDSCISCREQRMRYNKENRKIALWVPSVMSRRAHSLSCPGHLLLTHKHTHSLSLSFFMSLSPMQLPWGSWEKPGRQCCCFGRQWNEPSVFWHWNPEPQSWLRTAHSSISEKTEQCRC